MSDPLPTFSTPGINRRIIIARRPQGSPVAADFARSDTARPDPGAGTFLVRNLYLSADPVQRGWAANPALTPIGEAMRALTVGIVLDSRDPAMPVGTVVHGPFGWQDYAVATRAELLSGIAAPRAPLAAYAGVLGMPGVTAWLALHDIAPPAPGKAILVSTAAGTVGSIVGQIARQAGAHVVGLTGSDEKAALCVDRFGYHAAFNYRTGDLAATLAQARPQGFDIYFDNVGGAISDVTIRAMAKNGRIIQCGTAATDSWSPPPLGLRNEREILLRTLSWTGFMIFDHAARFGEAIDRLTDLLLAGRLVHDVHVQTGMDGMPHALEATLAGRNPGKMLAYIGEEP